MYRINRRKASSNHKNTHQTKYRHENGSGVKKGEKDIIPLGGSGGMLPRKNILNISYFKASI